MTNKHTTINFQGGGMMIFFNRTFSEQEKSVIYEQFKRFHEPKKQWWKRVINFLRGE